MANVFKMGLKKQKSENNGVGSESKYSRNLAPLCSLKGWATTSWIFEIPDPLDSYLERTSDIIQ